MILRRGSQALASARNNFALSLTSYEAGNAVWRLCLLERKITRSEALALVTTATDFLNLLQQIHFQDLNPNRILDIAISKRLTFYDASYIIAAETRRLTLVTDDRGLFEVAKQYVDVQPSQT
jgi:predicted nucleic acid-binding protein